MEIHVRNVNQALSEGLHWLRAAGQYEESRNGRVLVSPEPVLTVYQRPTERVLFSPLRDANPFFHFFEALWMLAGRDDLGWPLYFNSKFGAYSDDGKTLHGAYGRRWRSNFGYDQLLAIIESLRRNSESRRCVLTMWDATDRSPYTNVGESGGGDLYYALQPDTKDAPCNTHAYFDARDNRLNLTVCCRSNDIIWGAYGANAVHFSFLQEYVAAHVGIPVGVYRQFSNNYHLYPANVDDLYLLAEDAKRADRYLDQVQPLSMFASYNVDELAAWDESLSIFFREPTASYSTQHRFFKHVAAPMYCAWRQRKEHQDDGADYVGRVLAADWRVACAGWIARRKTQKTSADAS